ncbi:MAG: MGMT family protein [Sphingobacteriales bacterium]|jgi:methylated-DNA-protein-cysteine methyltransferase-like protein|nr:MGMT family protein [Sphingobacteriales bacterium]
MKEKKEKNKKDKTALITVKPSGLKDEDFFQQVFAIVRQIPKGRVTSFGAIAKSIGTGKSARMVGWAMNASHLAKPKVPAHRVVNSLGLLTGKFHFETPAKMEELLAKEGAIVVNDKVVDFKKKFWDPGKELSL